MDQDNLTISALSPEEREEAEKNLKGYLEVVKRIYDRLDDKEKEALLLKLQWIKGNRKK